MEIPESCDCAIPGVAGAEFPLWLKTTAPEGAVILNVKYICAALNVALETLWRSVTLSALVNDVREAPEASVTAADTAVSCAAASP
jgi:hypothetical protein